MLRNPLTQEFASQELLQARTLDTRIALVGRWMNEGRITAAQAASLLDPGRVDLPSGEKELAHRFADGSDVYDHDGDCPGCVALLAGLKKHSRPEAKDKHAAEDRGAAGGAASMLGGIAGFLRAQPGGTPWALRVEERFNEQARAMLLKAKG